MALTLAQGGGRAGISFDAAAWARVVRRFENASDKVSIVQRGVVAWAMQQGIQEAQHQLDTLVYKAPISASGYVRTGATRGAVGPKEKAAYIPEVGASGVIFVDPAKANRKGFYYPRILNRGRTDIRYYPRPFWSATRAVMKVRYQMRGHAALRELGQRLSID